MKLFTLLLPVVASGAVVNLGKSTSLAKSSELIIFSGTPNARLRDKPGLVDIFGCRRTCVRLFAKEKGYES